MSSVQRSNSEHVIQNEPAKVEIDGVFILYTDNDPYHMPVRTFDRKYPIDKVFMSNKSGKRLDDLLKVRYKDGFDLTTSDGVSRFRYEGTRLYVANPKHEDFYYGRAYDLQEIDMDSTAGEIFQKSKKLIPSAERPLVVLRLFCVKIRA